MGTSGRSSLASKLSDRGVRLTRQRRAVLEVMEDASEHLHASDLLRLAREKDDRIDRATVYRTLALLKDQGLVEELDLLHLDGAEHHYELRRGNGHVHIGCRRCGRIMEVHTGLVEGIADEIRRTTGWDVQSVTVEAKALCPNCRSEA